MQAVERAIRSGNRQNETTLGVFQRTANVGQIKSKGVRCLIPHAQNLLVFSGTVIIPLLEMLETREGGGRVGGQGKGCVAASEDVCQKSLETCHLQVGGDERGWKGGVGCGGANTCDLSSGDNVISGIPFPRA